MFPRSGLGRRARFLRQRPGYGGLVRAVRRVGERRGRGDAGVRPALGVSPAASFTGAVWPRDAGQRGLHTAGVGPYGGRGWIFIARGRRRGHVLQRALRYSDRALFTTIYDFLNLKKPHNSVNILDDHLDMWKPF